MDSHRKSTTDLPLKPSVALYPTKPIGDEEVDTERFIRILSDAAYYWYKRCIKAEDTLEELLSGERGA